MSLNNNDVKVTMIDALVGNDYSMCLCSALHAIGVNVELIVPENRAIDMPVEFPVRRWMPIKDPTGSKIIKTYHYFKYLVQLLIFVAKSNKKQQIVHFQFFRRERIESLFFPLLRLLGANLVFTAHNVLPHENNRADFILRFMVYKSAKIIVVHSDYIRNKLVENFRIDRNKIQVIPHGNFDHYAPSNPISKVEARESLNLSKRDDVVLFFGFIREYKGLDMLLDAFEICVRKGRRLRLVVAGAPRTQELGNHYRRRIDQISTDDSIIFHANFIPSEKVSSYIIASDVVALPYKTIDHSGIVHLAYSFGRPLIATNVGDFSEVIENGKSGYLLKTNSADCLSETILEAFSNKTRLDDMGNYARKLSETKYSWIDIARQTRDLYETQST